MRERDVDVGESSSVDTSPDVDSGEVMSGVSVYIYGLRDPSTKQIRYVGKSTQPEKRLRQHLADGDLHKGKWIQKLLAEGNKPELVILETVGGNWQEAERRWIAYGRAQGWPLTNVSAGGNGDNYDRGTYHEKMSRVMKGRRITWGSKISAAKRGKPLSEAHKRGISLAMTGKKRGPRHAVDPHGRANISNGTRAAWVRRKLREMVEDWT